MLEKYCNYSFYCKLLFLYIISILNGLLFNFIASYFSLNFENDYNLDISISQKFFILILFGPALETIILQHGPIQFVRKFFLNDYAAIIISAFIFSIVHYYNFMYVLMTFIGGLILGSVYILSENNKKIPVIYTFIFHSLYNLFGFIFIE